MTFQTFQSFMTFQPSRHYYTFQYFQYLPVFPVHPGIPPTTALQHSPVRIQILHTDWFPPETPLSTSRRQYTTTNFHSSKKGRCCDMGQNDTICKIELIPSSVLSEDNTNCCNDIHKFLQQFE